MKRKDTGASAEGKHYLKIYLAGLVQSGFVWRGNSSSADLMHTEEIRRLYPYDLESYHYLRDTRTAEEYFTEQGKKIFLDSGAFSMFTQGIKVDLQEYADYIKRNQAWIGIASNLDVIGAGNEEGTYRNQKTLEDMGVKICPVHHARDDDKWLVKYMKEGYDYIFLGGMVPESKPYLREWLDRIWGQYLADADGWPRVKIHGFGLTDNELMWRYPWYSVDSTSWVMKSRMGAVSVDFPHRVATVTFSDQSPTRRQLNQHFTTLDPITKAAVQKRCDELGYDPAMLATSYGHRDHWMIAFYQRMMQVEQKPYNRIMTGLFDA